MEITFYIAAIIAVVSTAMVITRLNAIHALLYLIVSLLAVALIFFLLGAPFAAALEVIIYAGAIMVLFVFVMMMLNLGEEAVAQENRWLTPSMWIGPGILSFVLLIELVYLLVAESSALSSTKMIPPQQVGITLFGPYLLAVELAAMLLLAGLVGAYHLGREEPEEES
ncbi:NADH dehydrogenase subunit J [Nitrosococcus oceani ATCC 19707]|uniref:NADH-quinone oxidoreductase subunit J n=2 Tax=Nitrosococcus oceani TaxID=1229 RepID=Q3JC23_NITOC|nr:NADH-quinone oxidoreductase subunit J [Nitrosococcus oceani]ABA57623.1 NADH dehydrogenase subunit J [Nitrosococcus oceani ATCC 19707]EDZ67115.1 NADH-ubiquinone/plastoquinone oxidoreductase chain 6 superfamily [Nitrosococcus oceani AFC27]KFI19907.1 NADH dehydrogenase [Nitrosococcus oceani C-27]GEM19262.1 NADH dehydrogenase subunit J [Nitrosococcus oceani]